MKIVHTEASCGWGGREIRILEEAKGIAVESLPIGRKDLAGALAMRRWIGSHAFDLLNCHSSTDSRLTAPACSRTANPPLIVRTRHISAPIPDNAPTRWLYTRATRHVVTTGEALRRDLIERNGYPAAMITSVPTGIDPTRFAPGDKAEARIALGLDKDAHYLGIVATLRSWKGHLHLLDAFASLNAPDWKLLIVGDGPMRDAIEQRIAELGLAEIVKQNVTGLFVAPRSPAAIAAALQSLIEDPALGQCLSGEAIKVARSQYTLDRMLDRMEQCFDAELAPH